MKKEGTKIKRMLAISLATVTLGILAFVSVSTLSGCSTKATNAAETVAEKPAGNPNLVTAYKPFG